MPRGYIDSVCLWVCVFSRRVHISQSTMECLHGEFDLEPGNGGERCEYLLEKGIDTYLVLFSKETTQVNGLNMVVSDDLSVWPGSIN